MERIRSLKLVEAKVTRRNVGASESHWRAARVRERYRNGRTEECESELLSSTTQANADALAAAVDRC